MDRRRKEIGRGGRWKEEKGDKKGIIDFDIKVIDQGTVELANISIILTTRY